METAMMFNSNHILNNAGGTAMMAVTSTLRA
nr:MAG TPA_asm: hypothetical protein [Caudoviricetes sp.]